MRRIGMIMTIAVMLAALTASPAAAGGRQAPARLLGELWTYLLETPTAENPFTGGDPCVHLDGGALVPFAPLGTTELRCTADSRTPIFVTAVTYECSTAENPPYFGSTPRELRACARADLDWYVRQTLTLDGRRVRLSEVETRLLVVRFPADNVLGTDEPGALSVGTAWAALLPPLSPGRHTLRIQAVPAIPTADAPIVDNTTTIVVRRR